MLPRSVASFAQFSSLQRGNVRAKYRGICPLSTTPTSLPLSDQPASHHLMDGFSPVWRDPVETGDSLLLFLLFYFFTHSFTYLPTRDENVLILLPSAWDMPQVTLARAGSWCLGALHGWVVSFSCQPPPAHCAEALFTEHSFLFSTSSTLYNGRC